LRFCGNRFAFPGNWAGSVPLRHITARSGRQIIAVAAVRKAATIAEKNRRIIMRNRFAPVGVAAVAAAAVLLATGCDTSGDEGARRTGTPPESVTVTGGDALVGRGMTYRFTADVEPAIASQEVRWTVEPATAGTINILGELVVAANAPLGPVTVRATTVGVTEAGVPVYGESHATVIIMPTGISLSPSNVFLAPGSERQLTAVITPEGAYSEIRWVVPSMPEGVSFDDGLLTVAADASPSHFTVRVELVGLDMSAESDYIVVPAGRMAVAFTGLPEVNEGYWLLGDLRDPSSSAIMRRAPLGPPITGGTGLVIFDPVPSQNYLIDIWVVIGLAGPDFFPDVTPGTEIARARYVTTRAILVTTGEVRTVPFDDLTLLGEWD